MISTGLAYRRGDDGIHLVRVGHDSLPISAPVQRTQVNHAGRPTR
jgi:hypothetical protein